MKRYNKRKIHKLILLCTFMGIFLFVSTYAWFTGMKTVSVSNFDVEVKAPDSLLLSIDGLHWSDTITINEDNFNTAAYLENTNNWGGKGLIPMSSIGELDPNSSTMKLYEKASLTSTPNDTITPTAGGYRLLASRVKNYETQLSEEQDGYVVFDLFIRNFSGEEYYPENKYGIAGNEEAIYLTQDSEVSIALGGVENTGIENSVRVAFAEIGRVNGKETNQDIITGITCYDSEDVTGICRNASIWEPNESRHVSNAINWYNKSCMKRIGPNNKLNESYSTNRCETITDEEYYPTYAVVKEIDTRYMPNVDVYDGYYNNYYETASDFDNDKLLYSVKTFTDYDKNQNGTDRQEIFYLAPNSITKVRVYIWIEGQDIDNYDFASLGKAIKVGFGFEKERFKQSEIENPETPSIEDTIPPTKPTNVLVQQVGNNLKIKASGSTDNIKVKGYKYSIDNEVWSNIIRPNTVYEFTNIGDVDNDFIVYSKAIDLAGNESPISLGSAEFRYIEPPDEIPPSTPTMLSMIPVASGIELKAGGSTDIGSGLKGYKYSIDNVNWSETIYPKTPIVLNATVDNTFYVKAIDKENNESYVYHDKIIINNYNYTGGSQVFTPTKDSNYILEVYGAQGGGNGGYGGYSVGTISLDNNDPLYIYVGGQGGRSSGGYNGGGSGQWQAGSVNPAAYGGGGATHIALVNNTLKNLSSNKDKIIIVAGGGGGGGENGSWGGAGGGTTGGNGSGSCYVAGGGNQTSGGTRGDSDATSGGFGYGGDAPYGKNKGGTYGAGGGGGGYYGGGGSSFSSGSSCAGGGGGGSGYINPSYLTNASMTSGASTGNGSAIITYIGNYNE